VTNFFQKLKNLFSPLAEAFDVRDLLVYGGLFATGYGFYQLHKWLGWVVLGLLSMLLGLGWILRVPK
jgi:hypothetical protein